MSAGAFLSSKYQTDDNNVVPIKIQPETVALQIGQTTNAVPTGNLQAGWPSARVGGSNRTIGINTRTVTVRLTETLEGYKPESPLTIPCLTPAMYAACVPGTAGSYLGKACIVVGRKPEKIK